MPNLYQDVNGDYRGFDENIHHDNKFTEYTVFSLWDTFRAEHPLLSLIREKRDSDMINTLLAHYNQSADHLLPMWEWNAGETWCMIGYHAVPVIVDGYLKGVKGFDAQKAYEAIKTTAMNPDYDGLASIASWVGCRDEEDESLSKTLEYAYDDWCIAQMAKALGKTDDYNYFMQRSTSFKNIFDPSIGWMRPKDSHGDWRTNFDAHLFGGGKDMVDVTEATSSQYSWFAPQDIPGLIELMGGKQKLVEKLDSVFNATQSDAFKKELSANDLRGCIGEYWHGNEPSHHVIYLYSLAGAPWKAAERLHQVVSTQYGSGPGSLCGNDDCGQMSAWYLFTCLGFYPVCPASDYYVIGAPQLPKAVMHLSNGKTFTMTAQNLSDQNIYVQSVRINGKELSTPYLLMPRSRRAANWNSLWGRNPANGAPLAKCKPAARPVGRSKRLFPFPRRWPFWPAAGVFCSHNAAGFCLSLRSGDLPLQGRWLPPILFWSVTTPMKKNNELIHCYWRLYACPWRLPSGQEHKSR